ncbi:hypothetical protein [Stenotrophomonas maltophilia]|nr:hypothetical protein [Stenotrophomonas maltophilia]
MVGYSVDLSMVEVVGSGRIEKAKVMSEAEKRDAKARAKTGMN